MPQGTFERLSSPEFNDLVSLRRPSLADLLVEADRRQPSLPFEQQAGSGAVEEFVPQRAFAKLPSRYQSNIKQAVMLFRFLENKENMSFSPVYTPMLGAMEDACNSAYQFRNKYIAHQEHAVVTKELAREQLTAWTMALRLLYEGSAPVSTGR